MWKPDLKKWLKRGKPQEESRPSVAEKKPRSTRPIVLIHGLNMPRLHLVPMGWRLSRSMGRPVHYFPYTSRLHDIPDTAVLLSRWLEARRITEFDAVTHSQGGVILRWAMTHCEMPTLHRAVLVAPPNEGSWLACRLQQKMGPLYPLIFGQAAMQLRAGDLGIAGRAGDLHGSEAGVIAGGSGQPTGIRNWFKIPGDCDGTVAVEETIFPGMKDFVLLPGDHTRLVMARRTADLARVFLETGLFRPGRKVSSH